MSAELSSDLDRDEAAAAQLDPDDRREPAAARLHLLLTPEDDGTFSAVVLNLPGAGSCGDTEAEAVTNAVESASVAIEEYEANGGPIPWRDSARDPIPAGSKAKWVVLNG